jgi:hypothetical protein
MTRSLPAAALLSAALTSGACIVSDTTHRLYLSPSGSLAWTALEMDVRSTESDPPARAREEQDWRQLADRGLLPVAEALRALGADDVSTRLLRSERPYAALTEARFARVDAVIGRAFDELSIHGRVSLDVRGGRSTLDIRIDLSSLDEGGVNPDSPIRALFEERDRYSFVLTDGRFVEAVGFEIREDGVVARLQQIPDNVMESGADIQLRLVWAPD